MADTSRRRPNRPSWTSPIADRLTPTIKAFVIASAIVYVFYVFVRNARAGMEAHLALGPGFLRGELWQPATSLFIHLDPIGFIFDMIGLWFVGALIERLQGARRLVGLFLVAGVAANVTVAGVWALRPYQPPTYADGCLFPVLAFFMAWGRIYGRAPAQILGGLYVQARNGALILVGTAMLISLAQGNWPSVVGAIVAAVIGWFGAAPGLLKDAWGTLKARRLRRRYRVIDGGNRPRKDYMN
jgi:membrane associated rhomboid family serine protease